MIRLSVNVDHVATLRNARGGTFPDPVEAARAAIAAGADGITVHLREDRRHIRDADVQRIRAEVPAPLNFEMAATEEMVGIACALRPPQCCLVPEKRAELTTEGGLDVIAAGPGLAAQIARLREAGVAVSIFVDPEPAQVAAAAAIGAVAVELHTGTYVDHPERRDREYARLRDAAAATRTHGIACHAGHGLDYATMAEVAHIPEIVEVSIGHFLICQAVFDGLGPAVTKMKAVLTAAR